MHTLHPSLKLNPLKTKEDMSQAVKQICHPLKPFYSKGFAHLRLGNTGVAYPDSIAEMEGFSRLLWGLVPLLAGEKQDDDIWDLHLQGIKNGTNPEHEEYWGTITDYDQRSVEMAVFGLALLLIPEKIWEPLSSQEKKHLSSWLRQINEVKVHDCNWLFFPVLVNLGLKHVGEPHDRVLMERNMQRIDQFYLSNGWYEDGRDGHADYYGPFAIHYYSLIYAKYMEAEDPERSHMYKERAESFAKDFIYWFASDGPALPYGRSLTYRFAQSAFWSAAVFAGIQPFSVGVMKGIILRNLRWWFRQPIFNDASILQVGYTYPNLGMAENYNSPGSPYWALKTFLPLALDNEHPFWKAEEEPLPALNKISIQKEPHLVLCRDEHSKHILAFNTGHLSTNEHTHTSAKYEKFIYSTMFGFSVPRAEWGLPQGAFDSTLALSEGDNLYRVKRKCEEYDIQEEYLYTRWRPWHDVEVKTWLVPHTPWHVRIHRIDTKRPLDLAEGGFALGIEREELTIRKEENTFLAQHSNAASAIKILHGNGKLEGVYPNANTNLMHRRTVIPTITSTVQPGVSWLVSAVYGSNCGNTNDKHIPEVSIENDRISIKRLRENTIFIRLI